MLAQFSATAQTQKKWLETRFEFPASGCLRSICFACCPFVNVSVQPISVLLQPAMPLRVSLAVIPSFQLSVSESPMAAVRGTDFPSASNLEQTQLVAPELQPSCFTEYRMTLANALLSMLLDSGFMLVNFLQRALNTLVIICSALRAAWF